MTSKTATLLVILCKLLIRNTIHAQEVCGYIDYMEKDISNQDIACVNNSICNKTFRITYINLIPHNLPDNYEFENTTGYAPIDDILYKCCGSCVKYHIHTLENISELNHSVIQNSHFVFPILAKVGTNSLYGVHFIPYSNVPDIMYITLREGDQLMPNLLQLYPLIIVCLLMAIVSGFVAWIIETWSNKDEFPRGFLIGWFEGFWWSFISMTTVGYGDKTPRSIPARLFSVIWILIGIISFGILTGEVTAQIMKANSPPPPSMEGKEVGVLRFRDYDAYVVTEHGGTPVRNEYNSEFIYDVVGLIKKLREGRISGFVLDKWTLAYVSYWQTDNKKILADHPEVVTQLIYLLTHTKATEEPGDVGQQLSYGMLVNNKDDYNYMNDFVMGNDLLISALKSKDWIHVKRNALDKFYQPGSSLLFSPDKLYFRLTIQSVAGMLVFIILFGIIYECKRKTSKVVTEE